MGSVSYDGACIIKALQNYGEFVCTNRQPQSVGYLENIHANTQKDKTNNRTLFMADRL